MVSGGPIHFWKVQASDYPVLSEVGRESSLFLPVQHRQNEISLPLVIR